MQLLLLGGLWAGNGLLLAQSTQGQAFNDGKSYKPANTDIKNGINAGAMTNVPGQDAGTTSSLTGFYGTNLTAPGQNKIAACAAYVPGSDAYKNAECETVNYVAGNPSTRPTYTIDKINDPLIIQGNNIRNTAPSHTAGMSGLSGTYTACTNQTTNQPERYDTERCQVGRLVTENRCSATLSVTYTWQRFAGQGSADLRYGYCDAGQVRGDQLTIPHANAYRTETALCADNGHGTGVETNICYRDCTGSEVLHGYDASTCSAPPTPASSDPPRQAIQACTDAPRTNENCFTPDGHFTARVNVPVFQDHWDNSACAELDGNGAVITN